MFVSCSEISVSVIFKYVGHIGTIRAFYLPGGTFQCCETEKIAGLLSWVNIFPRAPRHSWKMLNAQSMLKWFSVRLKMECSQI